MTRKTNDLNVNGTLVRVLRVNDADYICISDIAALKNSVEPKDVVKNWMRSRATISFLGLWERLHNTEFKGVDFDPLLRVAGDNAFTMSPTRLISEFERLKAEEQKQLGWNVRRELSKINYRIHTDAIKQNLIPTAVTRAQMSIIYANEADVLNVALFGKTAQQWERENPDLKGNQRDYATINELICLSNMENINAVMVNDGIPQPQRLKRLNEIAIHQMKVLTDVGGRNLLT